MSGSALLSRLRQTSVRSALPVSVVLAAAFALVVRAIPLSPVQVRFLSSYGVVDNRELLLTYLSILVAVALGPILVPFLTRGRATTATAPSRFVAEPRPQRRTLHRVLPPLLIAIPLAFLLIGPGVAFAPLNGHELVHLGYLSEINHGRVLNVDTRTVYGPLLGYCLWLFMKVTSFSIVGFRTFWNVLTAFTLVMLLWGAYPRFRSRGLLVVLVLYLLLHTSARYFLPDGEGINHGFWGWANLLRHGWVPVLLLWLSRGLERTRGSWFPPTTGVLILLGALWAQETLHAGGVALATLLVFSARNLRTGLRDLARMLLGFGIAAGVLLAWLVARGGLGEFLRAWSWGPRLFWQGAGNTPFPSVFDGEWAWLFHLVPALSVLILLDRWVRILRGNRSEALLFSAALYACLSYPSVMVRADIPHLLNGMLPHLLVWFLVLDRGLQTRKARHEARKHFRVPVLAIVAVLAVPLLFFRPGVGDLILGFRGRLTHPVPAPPSGWERIPVPRAGIWTPRDNWFDSPAWGRKDDPAAVAMIRDLARGRDTFIAGKKASLYYFLADVPCATPYTDMSSQCSTAEEQERLRVAFREANVEYNFLMAEFERKGWTPLGYRRLGISHGFVVFQRLDLSPVKIP